MMMWEFARGLQLDSGADVVMVEKVHIRSVGMAKKYFLYRSLKAPKMEKFSNHSAKELSKNLRNSRVFLTFSRRC